MIANQRQYQMTRIALERFEQARRAVDEQGTELPPRARQALRDQYDSQIDELRAELAEYDALRSGRVSVLELGSLGELPAALIRARAATGLSQEELAARLGLKKQQVQRYEATQYAGVSLARIEAVARALGLQVREQVFLPACGTDQGPDAAPTED